MGDPTFMLDVALKAREWEMAKAHLRALAALQASYASDRGRLGRWKDLEDRIAAFIETIEDEGLHE